MQQIRDRAREQLRHINRGTNVDRFFRELRSHGYDHHGIDRAEKSVRQIMCRVPDNATTPTGAVNLDPNALYPRRALLAMGMPRRLINSLSSTTVARGQYLGSAVLQALANRT